MYENISLEVVEMFNEDIFNFDINNIKTDLAIEGLTITDEDINLYKQFANEEIDMPNLIQTIKNDIAIYSAHTNLDNTVGGVNFKIAEKIGLRDVTFLTPSQNNGMSGSGIIGTLSEPETETDFLRRIKKLFEVGCLRHNKMTGRQIQRVAICGGAGAFLIPDAIAAAADVFITGEIRYHEYFGHEREILLAEIGHYESEQYTKELLAEYLQRQFPGLKVEQTKINTNPIKYL